MSNSSLGCEWREALPLLVQRTAGQVPRLPQVRRYRFGAAVVEVNTDYQPLIDELETFYGDCACDDAALGASRIGCSATLLTGTPLLWLSFDSIAARSPVDVALGMYRFCRRSPYIEQANPSHGWRAVTDTTEARRLIVAGSEKIALVNLDLAPPEFVLDCIVGNALAAQPDLLFLHAASVGIAGAGALILAPSFGGKSTVALTLASRGHAFLGDDVGAIKLATRDLLPFPRSAGLRDGPLEAKLRARLQTCRHARAPARDGALRTVVRVSELFPRSVSGPLPLRFAFLLDGITDRAKITPFQPRQKELRRLRNMVVLDAAPVWGRSPGRDLMQLLGVMSLLSGLRCYLLETGSIEDAAGLIEHAMTATPAEPPALVEMQT